MKSKLGVQYYVIPLIYIALVFFFLSQHNAGDRQSFSFSSGLFSVSGTRGNSGIEAELLFFGKSIDLERDITVPGNYLTLQSVEGDQQHIIVSYKEGLSLAFQKTGRIELSSPGDVAAQIKLPLFVGTPADENSWEGKGWRLTKLKHLPGALLNMRGDSYLLDFHKSSISDDSALLLNGDGGSVSILSGLEGDPRRFWFFRGEPPVEKSESEALLRDYLESAYRGWRSGRFNQAEESWSTPDGSLVFNESALIALIAEGYRRRESVDLGEMKGISARHQDMVSWESSPYTGSILTHEDTYRIKREEDISAIRSYVKSADPELFAVTSHLVELLLVDGDGELIEELANLFSSGALLEKPFSSEELSGLAEAYIDSRDLYSERFSGFSHLLPLIEAKLLPRIGRIGQGVFLLENRDGLKRASSELRSSLRAAYYLQEIGVAEDKPLFEELGWTMIHSILSKSDEYGVLPERVVAEGSGQVQEGYLLPETIYGLIAENNYIPRNVFLFNELDSQVSLHTVGQGISASRGSDSWAISFSFPSGDTHLMVVRNVPAFSYIELYGIRWNGTRQFQAYDAGGWYYDRNTETFYVKVRHRRNREEVVIHFRDNRLPAQTPAAPAPPSNSPAPADSEDSASPSEAATPAAPATSANGEATADENE